MTTETNVGLPAVGSPIERGVGRLVKEHETACEPVLLHTLPPGHELRQRPLLRAQCRNLHSKEWRDIRQSWGIAPVCFDQLGEAWTSTTEFRMTPNVAVTGRQRDDL